MNQQAVQAFLERNILQNILPLKMLKAYGEAINYRHYAQGDTAGVMFTFSPQTFPYDAQTYAYCDQIVVISTNGQAAANALLAQLPSDQILLFKLMSHHDQQVIAARFPLERITGFYSYTSPAHSSWPAVPGITVTAEPTAQVMALFASQGHDPAELKAYFAAGSLAFIAQQGEQIQALCYIYQNYASVWEIGGVYTLPEARRQGHAQRVVAAALHTLHERQFTPRYQVHETNLPSIHLAESLSLERFVTVEHYLYRPSNV